jgi:hypothetical protein
MFGSQILEVGIGLILVFLIVSLILTAVRESLEAWSKTRARDLEVALAELLDDPGGQLRAEFFDHPLVYGLFRGKITPTVFDADGKVANKGAGNLPSYIPRETFAIVVQDLLASQKIKDLMAQPNVSGKLQTAYDALNAVSHGDAERIRKGIENWYDASMDRVSGWYKRRTQFVLFWLGLLVALGLNINAIAIAQYLSTNQVARDHIAAIAEGLEADPQAKAVIASATPRAQPAGDNAASNAAAANVADPNASDSNAAAATGPADAAGTDGNAAGDNAQTGGSGNSSASTTQASPAADQTRLANQLDAALLQAGLPIGWDPVQVQRIEHQFANRGVLGWIASFLVLLAGYLMVAFAATLGAPFWFDLLGKFMVVRSTVKPTEKSPDEVSKDGGTGGSPKVQPKTGS